MLKQHHNENIEPTEFKDILDSYEDEVPEKLAELEKHRLEIIPEALSERNAKHLTKKEVQTLVDWKLYVKICPLIIHIPSIPDVRKKMKQ